MNAPSQGERLVRCRTAGQVAPLDDQHCAIRVGRSWCGSISDGVALEFSSMRGSVVLEWADFERAYLLNKQLREELGPALTVDELRQKLLRQEPRANQETP